jgi:copper resistance protein B
LTSLQAGLRLRYDILREAAPYVGVEWQRDLGRTARYTRAGGERASRTLFVAGIRAWF